MRPTQASYTAIVLILSGIGALLMGMQGRSDIVTFPARDSGPGSAAQPIPTPTVVVVMGDAENAASDAASRTP
jgi:hypothetical protein